MKFAHISDVHLGFQKDEALKKIEQDTFTEIIDGCISEKADFVLICGDLFHVNIPEMRVQKFAFKQLRRLHDEGIPAYAIYGSHDFSPVANSVIDLLEEAGYITKVSREADSDGEGMRLEFTVDQKTGVKIVGLPGLKSGRDVEYYRALDREHLESEPGTKIFLFHGGIREMSEGLKNEGDNMPLSLFPKGFAYYAGGHMHRHRELKFEDYKLVAYPGTPFAGYYKDMEDTARGLKRGYVMVESTKNESIKTRFIEVGSVEYEVIEQDAKDRIAEKVNADLQQNAKKSDVKDKIVIMSIHGEMTSGKTAEVDVSEAKKMLRERGALAVEISKNRLKSKEYEITAVRGSNKEEIEGRIFAENIGQIRVKKKELKGDAGTKTAKELLRKTRQPKPANETKKDYKARISNDATDVLGLETR